ncbi:MAG: hypothetical protein ACOYXR_13615 [Nitrospirota bacterium]
MTAGRAGFLLAVSLVLAAACHRDSPQSTTDPCAEFALRSDVGGLGVAQGLATYSKPVITAMGPTGSTVTTPIRYAEIEVLSCQSGGVLASGATDADGRFRITFSNPGRVGVYARVLSSSSRYPVSVQRSAAEPFVYGLASTVFDDAGDGETVTVSGLDAVEAVGAGVFNILEQGLRGSETVESLTGSAPTAPLVWHWYPGNPVGTSYTTATRVITVLGTDDDADEFDDPVLLHEYGHYVLDVYSRDDSPGGPHALGESSLDLRLAWSEGWADFFSSVARNDPQHTDTGNGEVLLSFNIETPPTLGEGTRYDTNELAIAAALWDAHDASDADEGAGVLNGLLARIWSVVRGLTAQPVTFEDFWTDWQAANPGDFQPILADLQIDLWPDGWEAGANDDDPSRPTPISLYSGTNPSAIQHHTLYPAGDVDYVTFTAPVTGTYTVATSRCAPLGGGCVARVSNAADTILDVLGVTPADASTVDNLTGRTYPASCGGSTCPPNSASTLSSKITFPAVAGASYVIRVARSPDAPPSAGETGSYDIVVTEGP